MILKQSANSPNATQQQEIDVHIDGIDVRSDFVGEWSEFGTSKVKSAQTLHSVYESFLLWLCPK